jgi:hypothetical protein
MKVLWEISTDVLLRRDSRSQQKVKERWLKRRPSRGHI